MALKYAAELPSQIPPSLTVYRLAAPQCTTAQVAASSKRFGLSGKMRQFIISDDWTSYDEGRYRVSVHRNSGALRYINRDKYGTETEREFKLRPREVEKIAEDFLGRTRVVPPKQARLHKITYLRSGVSDVKGKRKTEKILDAGVIYRRLVDETQVEGPGGFAMVHIEPEGEVVGLRSIWRPTFKREARVKIIPVSQVLESFEKQASGFYGDTTVTSASFGYFEQGESDRQTYLEPAYVFIYMVQNDEVAHKSIEVVAASEKKYARLKGKKRFAPGAQPKRHPSKETKSSKGRRSKKA